MRLTLGGEKYSSVIYFIALKTRNLEIVFKQKIYFALVYFVLNSYTLSTHSLDIHSPHFLRWYI